MHCFPLSVLFVSLDFTPHLSADLERADTVIEPYFWVLKYGGKWAEMSAPKSQKSPWDFIVTSRQRMRAVRKRLSAYEVTAPEHVAIIVAVLDQHGLFNEVTTPRNGDMGKYIWRRAMRSAKALWRRIINIRVGKLSPTNPQEAALAQRWEQLSTDRMNLEKLKVMSEDFQINRGGRIIPRYARQESRNSSPRGPRSEPEITHALQILDRYLREECLMRTNRRMECLGDIRKSAMNLRESREDVSEQVRWRLRDAETKTPLDDVDYYEATGVSYKLNDDRQDMFWKCQNIFYSPESAEEQQNAEDTMEKLFSYKQVETQVARSAKQNQCVKTQ